MHPMSLTDLLLLTGLVGGDVDSGVSGWGGVFPRNPVDSLHLETVAGVSLQIPHHDLPLPQPQPAGSDVHVVVTACARAPVSQTFLTHHIIDQIAPPACVLRLLPLQGQRGLVHAGYNVARRWGDRCAKHTRRQVLEKVGRQNRKTHNWGFSHFPCAVLTLSSLGGVKKVVQYLCKMATKRSMSVILFFL